MITARDAILGAVAKALKRNHSAAAVDRRLARHPAGPVPAIGRLSGAARRERFRAEAEAAAASVATVAGLELVPAAVARFLDAGPGAGLVAVRIAPALAPLPWAEAPGLSVHAGIADRNDAVGVTVALCAVAETGTVVLGSGPQTPASLAALPETLVVVVDGERVFGGYEESWAWLRARDDDGMGGGFLPRVVTWVTGPSRTADIEQTVLLGAHGPRRLHVVLVGEGEA